MSDQLSPLSPEKFLRNIFTSQAVQHGQVLRRKICDIERYVGMDVFLYEVRARGFQAVENRDQVLVYCNNAPIRGLVRGAVFRRGQRAKILRRSLKLPQRGPVFCIRKQPEIRVGFRFPWSIA